jgi:outer membrane protein TolC
VDAAQAQMDAVNAQLADLRNHIDQQVRSALLDVDARRSWSRWPAPTSSWPPAR